MRGVFITQAIACALLLICAVALAGGTRITPVPRVARPARCDSAAQERCDWQAVGGADVVYGYWAGWRTWDPSVHNFTEALGKFTHIAYAFAAVAANYSVVMTRGDNSSTYRLFDRLTNGTGIKRIISVGGAGASNALFSSLAASASNQQVFADSAVAFCKANRFDGVDLDWETPVAKDKSAYVSLLATLRNALQAASPPLLLSIAVPVSESRLIAGYDIPNIHPQVDLINLMAYDLHGGWEKITGEHTALTSVVGDTDTVEQGVKNWLQGGAPASKVVLGLAAYGHGWTLANQSDTGLGAPTTGGSAPGPYSNASGILTFGEIQHGLLDQGATSTFDAVTQTMITVKDDQWLGHDDVKTWALKVAFARREGLRGVMVWSVDQDDYQDHYPLINSLPTP